MEHCPLLVTKERNKKHAHTHSGQQTWVFFFYVEMIELIKVCEGYNKHYQFMASHFLYGQLCLSSCWDLHLLEVSLPLLVPEIHKLVAGTISNHQTTAHLLWDSINVAFILFKLAISRSEHKWAKFTCMLNFSA